MHQPNRIKGRLHIKFIVLVAFLFYWCMTLAGGTNRFVGINFPGAAFGESVIPGVHGKNFIRPTSYDINLYADIGFNAFRIAILWERFQPILYANLDEIELQHLDGLVESAMDRNALVIIDLHNYGKYAGVKIGESEVQTDAIVDFWIKISKRYVNHSNVAFGLMNEPFEHKPNVWAKITQDIVMAIRDAGSKNLILISGTFWSSANLWFKKDGEISNAEAFVNIVDPENNYLIDFHQYFDKYSAGDSAECVNENIGVDRLKQTTDWLRANGKLGFVGEFGAADNLICLKALDVFLEYLKNNSNVWVGWTYWAASPWLDKYMYSVFPPGVAKSPQLSILKKYF